MESFFEERSNKVYTRVVELAKTCGVVRVIMCEVNGYDEDQTQIVRYADGVFSITSVDDYSSDGLSEDDVAAALKDLEKDHYTIVEVAGGVSEFPEWEDHEIMYQKPALARLCAVGETLKLLPSELIVIKTG